MRRTGFGPAVCIWLLLLLASAAAAQERLIGFTARQGPPGEAISRQTVCQKSAVACRNALSAPTVGWIGGLVYDHRDHTIWQTNGDRIQQLTIAGCQRRCIMAAPRVMNGSMLGGLTFDRRHREMIHVESLPSVAALVVYGFTPAICPVRRRFCRFQLPPDYRTGAVAYDGKRDRILVAASRFDIAAPGNLLYVVPRFAGNACRPICRVSVPRCGSRRLGAIRAMTYDACRDLLYASDGRQTSILRVSWTPAGCPKLEPLRCCPIQHPLGHVWLGFDFERDRGRRGGRSCTSAPCAPCPAMRFDIAGTAVVGDPDFGFTFTGAPSNSNGFVLLNTGACTNGVPFACGRVVPRLAGLIGLGPIPLPGAGACGGRGKLPLPLPNSYALCDLRLCAQGVVACPGGGLGLTNAIQFAIQQ